MTDFNPAAQHVMARRATVLGHQLSANAPLTITGDPKAPGEVTEPLARFLHGRGLAVPADQARPTPVETPEQEAERLKAEAAREAARAAPETPAPAEPAERAAPAPEQPRRSRARPPETDD